MSKSLTVLFIIIALTTGYLATVSITNYVNENRLVTQQEMAQEQMVPVLVAAYQIPMGSKIGEEHISKRNHPKSLVHEHAHTDTNNVMGRVTSTTIFKGEPILETRLQKEGAEAGLSGIIPEGLRAITLRVDDTSSVAGFVKPGNFVDVVANIRQNNSGEPISKTILQNVKIIATGSEIVPAEGEEKDAKTVPTVTVLASLEQVERLSLASDIGKIRLVLRSNADQQQETTKGATLSSLLPDAEQDPMLELPVFVEETLPSPTPQPRQPVVRIHEVELYTGANKEILEFRR